MGARLFYETGSDLDKPYSWERQPKYLVYNRAGLIKKYTLFKKLADSEDRDRMNSLITELQNLGPSPFSYLQERFDLAKRITGLKLKVGSTVTVEGLDFSNFNNEGF
jgi:hypothetical protein